MRDRISVSFVGAGPGAPDLLTLRGRNRLAQADLILYADSLVHPGLLAFAKPEAVVRGTADLHLDQVVALMIETARKGATVVRLHSGDPSLYGAITEQMERLETEGILYEVVPGVSSLAAAAAALPVELTRPGLAQTVIMTREEGRTGMPDNEALVSMARHQTTLVLYLSVSRLSGVVRKLRDGGYPPDTPVVVVYRASWEDERLIRGTLETIVSRVKAAKITRQALILVGRVLDRDALAPARSKLYDPTFSHGFRRRSR